MTILLNDTAQSNIERIIQAFEKYDPFLFQKNIPVSRYSLGENPVPVRVDYDNRNNVRIHSCSPDDTLSLILTYAEGWYISETSYHSVISHNQQVRHVVKERCFQTGQQEFTDSVGAIIQQVADNMQANVVNPYLHKGIEEIEASMRPFPGLRSYHRLLGDYECYWNRVNSDHETLLDINRIYNQFAQRMAWFIQQIDELGKDPTPNEIEQARLYASVAAKMCFSDGVITDLRYLELREGGVDYVILKVMHHGAVSCPWEEFDRLHELPPVRNRPFSHYRKGSSRASPTKVGFIGSEYPFSGGVLLVVNTQIEEATHFPGSGPHLIGDHHFFGGIGSAYRMDPLTNQRVLNV